MDKKKKNSGSHSLSREDMIKYLKGELSPAEQHRVEKILLEEGFEAGAMDGLSTRETKQIEEDLDHLNERLHERIKSRPAFGVLRIAATIILLALFSFGVYFLLNRQREEKQISYNMDRTAGENKGGMKALSMEEAQKSEAKTVVPDTGSREKERVQSKVAEGPLAYNQAAKDLKKKQVPPGSSVRAASPARIAADENIGINEQKSGPAFEEELEASGVPAPESDTYAVVSETAGQKDKTREQTFPAKDGALNVDSKPARPEMVRSEQKRAPQLEISAMPEKRQDQISGNTKDESEGEIVEIHSDQKPGKNANGHNLPARPSIGMNAYKAYIKEHMHYPEELKNSGIKGTVVVAFNVGADGKLKYLHIEKSLGNLFDKEAVRLIVDGPQWLPEVEAGEKKESKVRVRIRFVPPRM